MPSPRTKRRLALDKIDLIKELDNNSAPSLMIKYGVSKEIFHTALNEQLNKRNIPSKRNIFDTGYERMMISKPSDGAWSKSREKQFVINNRAFIKA